MSELCLIIAVGGPSCSGKTTLSKHLARIIPHSTILHQDDFAPPADTLPIHPTLNVADWDRPDTAIQWDRMRQTLRDIKATGKIPDNHKSHDILNEQIPVPIPQDLVQRWNSKFSSLITGKISIILADGFLLYYDQECNNYWDLRIFVREDEEILFKRREERNGYVTAEGEFWKDPPEYWSQIVWPSYIQAHKHLFINGDVISGQPKPEFDLLLLKGEIGGLGMANMVEKSCQRIFKLLTSLL